MKMRFNIVSVVPRFSHQLQVDSPQHSPLLAVYSHPLQSVQQSTLLNSFTHLSISDINTFQLPGIFCKSDIIALQYCYKNSWPACIRDTVHIIFSLMPLPELFLLLAPIYISLKFYTNLLSYLSALPYLHTLLLKFLLIHLSVRSFL